MRGKSEKNVFPAFCGSSATFSLVGICCISVKPCVGSDELETAKSRKLFCEFGPMSATATTNRSEMSSYSTCGSEMIDPWLKPLKKLDSVCLESSVPDLL